MSIAERITVGAGNFLHRLQDSVGNHDHKGENGVATGTPGPLSAEGEGDSVVEVNVDGGPSTNHVDDDVDNNEEQEAAVSRSKGRFTVTVKQRGATKSVVAEIEVRPAAAPVKGKGKGKQGERESDCEESRSWVVQLKCLKCENPLD